MSEKDDSKVVATDLSRSERRRAVREAAKAVAPALRQTLHAEGMSAFVNRVGLEAFQEVLEDEINEACGVTGKWEQCRETRHGYRNGRAPGVVWIGGRSVCIESPRAISKEGGGEILLPSYLKAQDPEYLSHAVLTHTVMGVSLRKYRPTILTAMPMEAGLESPGLSKSSIGRRFIAAADRSAEHYLKRPLEERFLVVWIDGVSAGDFGFISALGLTTSGKKEILGLRQGSTENSTLCAEFLEDLISRGFSAKRGVLFVVDGSPAISKALREVFGADVLIQRCQVHKKRNLIDKLPDSAHEAISANLAEVFSAETATLAMAKAELLARSLEAQKHYEAANSLREGGPELFTCCRLGIPSELWGSLTNTNPIESTFSNYRSATRRIKRWCHGQQVVRWAAVTLQVAEKSFESVGNPQLLSKLAIALERAVRKGREPLALTG